MRHGNLAVLVTALLFVGDLVLDLQRAGAGFDHLLSEQIGCLGITETGIDIGNDRNDMGLEILDLVHRCFFCCRVTSFARRINVAEQKVQFAGIGLAKEGVKLFDQRRHRGFLVHRLIRQGTELAAQRGNHPAGQIEIAALGAAEMLLDRNHLLLRDKAVPATQRLGIFGAVGIIGGHILAHDCGGIFGDVEAGLEPVLQLHPGNGFGVDTAPRAVLVFDQALGGAFEILVGHRCFLKIGEALSVVLSNNFQRLKALLA